MSNIIVAGTGPAGMLAALALARDGFQVALVGPAANREDGRTTALMAPAIAFLDVLGLRSAIEPASAPLRTMRIIDGTRRLIRSPVVTFHAAEIAEEFFGLNIPNRVLNQALEDAVTRAVGITRHETIVDRWTISQDRVEAHLADGTELSAELAVAADGRNSPARDAAGISTSTKPYRQSAVVLTFAHARGHGFISTEFHTETGPFTQVPLPGNRSSLVWVVEPWEAERLAHRGAEELSLLIEERMQSMLGRVTVDSPVQVYPLSASLPSAFARNRVALVGEAAHMFPPIGAQGLNLGVRDVQELVEIASQYRSDPGSAKALSAYDAKRRPDILARSGAVSLLNRSLLSDMLPAQIARSAGLGLLGSIGPLRAFVMREGMKPGSGFSSLFSALREQVRR
ncbi:UbiH/UbiF family hydroxylase [Pseudaminobacter sp. 19-2017]|uniref:UbiH/UbiF family hydroxylase n=1 Tax=Pseudaminobacter soli (ex Zhang et al. 2022) TaxID=2831468 RepID=A0A942DYQ0_9HYPH|nr:UbiH/UbiF family hydroxylase [Pseudaminobacter soli]MBS3647370.1 UbiH/UbiF family hydroxylase [Pseudaminobacter soli]